MIDPHRLRQIAYADGTTLWEYDAPPPETMSEMFGNAYFIPACHAFGDRDIIALSAGREVRIVPISGFGNEFLRTVH